MSNSIAIAHFIQRS